MDNTPKKLVSSNSNKSNIGKDKRIGGKNLPSKSYNNLYMNTTGISYTNQNNNSSTNNNRNPSKETFNNNSSKNTKVSRSQQNIPKTYLKVTSAKPPINPISGNLNNSGIGKRDNQQSTNLKNTSVSLILNTTTGNKVGVNTS